MAVPNRLRAVLDVAQIRVCLGQLFGHRAVQHVELRQRVERPTRAHFAQLQAPAAPDELLHLGQELDLADAPGAELDVLADAGPAPLPIDAILHGAHGEQRAEIQIAPIDEGLERDNEFLPRIEISPAGPHFDQGVTLPVAALVGVVLLQGIE